MSGRQAQFRVQTAIKPTPRHIKWGVAAIWLCFLLRASFYCAAVPLWEGWDEYAHFDYVRCVALRGKLPGRDSLISGEVAASLQLVPLPWTLREYFPSVQHLTHDAYWRLTEAERRELQSKLASLGSNRTTWQESGALTSYEAQHPPAYYVLMAGAYELVRRQPLADRVWWLRLLSVTLASLAVPATYLLGRSVFGCPACGVGAAAVLTAMPGVMITVSRVSNEALAMALGAAILATLAERKRNLVMLGVLLGLALLTKAYFLTTALAVFGCLAVDAWRSRSGAQARRLMLVAILSLALAGWWYWLTWRVTGSISGEEHDVAFHRLSLVEQVHAAWRVHWMRVLDTNFCTHIWAGGWSYLGVRSWIYHAFAMLAAAGAAGAVWVARGKRDAVRSVAVGRLAARWTALLLAAFALGLAYHAVTIYAAHSVSAVNGWYIDCLVAGEVVLWALGLMAFLSPSRGSYVFPLLALMFLALDGFAMHTYLLPYYGGFVAHTKGNHIPAMKLAQLADGGWRLLCERLAVNKPVWLNGHAIRTLWACYIAGSCGTLAIAGSIARRSMLHTHVRPDDTTGR